MKSYDVPQIGTMIRVFICEDIGGGYYVAKVLNTSSPEKGQHFALINIQRKYQDGRISPCDLDKKSMTIPLHATELWEYVKDGK